MPRRMDAKAKSRVRLWLQSEKIFGLPSVAAPPILLDRIEEPMAVANDLPRAKTSGILVSNDRKVPAAVAPMKQAPKVAPGPREIAPAVAFDPGPALIPLGATAAKVFEAPVLESD